MTVRRGGRSSSAAGAPRTSEQRRGFVAGEFVMSRFRGNFSPGVPDRRSAPRHLSGKGAEGETPTSATSWPAFRDGEERSVSGVDLKIRGQHKDPRRSRSLSLRKRTGAATCRLLLQSGSRKSPLTGRNSFRLQREPFRNSSFFCHDFLIRYFITLPRERPSPPAAAFTG